MSTIKGQNLRLFVSHDGLKCIAAATSCSLHMSAEVSDMSTKDTDSDFAENAVTGMNWEITVDALVTDGTINSGTVRCTEKLSELSNKWIYPQPIRMLAGDTITLSADSGTSYLLEPDGTVVESATGQSISYEADDEITVYVGCSSNTVNVTFHAYDSAQGLSELDYLMRIKDPVRVSLSTVNGPKNRDTDEEWLTGNVIITDLNITAANKQFSTYTARLTGVGELDYLI